MKIVHAASEVFPYVKTGGLADAVGSLATTLADRGHEVSVFLPGYRIAQEHLHFQSAQRRLRLKLEMGDRFASSDVLVFSPRRNLTYYLVCREEFFDRRGIYGNGERDFEDNDNRFIYFAKAVVETLRLLEFGADIVHAHDWPAALVPLMLRYAERRHGVTLALRTVFTVHNLAFQGVFPMKSFAHTNLPDELMGIDGLEFYGQMSFIKGGLLFADHLTTVSPQYAQEILTSDFGCGLEGVLQARVSDLVGLVNGIDTGVWNPAADAALPARYTADDLAGKAACREALLNRLGLTVAPDMPVFGVVARLTEQKGVPLLLANREFFREKPVGLVILGKGEAKVEAAVRELVGQAPRRMAMAAVLDEAMSHLVEAGSDFFLMPSLFEPCGLNQMYSQVYGTLPVVTRVGGLVDTVVDVDEQPEEGTGIMVPPTVHGLKQGLERALRLFGDKARLAAAQQRGMRKDFSWTRAVEGYERLYLDGL